VGIRETLEKKKSLSMVAAVVVLVGSLIAIFVQARGSGPSIGGSIYVTEDDGKTFTPASPKQLIGLGKNGQPMAEAHVFMCGGKQVVGYMTRYTPDSVKLLMEVQADRDVAQKPGNAAKLAQIPFRGMEIKKPGQADWVSQGDTVRVARIRPYVCPDGTRPPEILP
jgi:hypothetical protein